MDVRVEVQGVIFDRRKTGNLVLLVQKRDRTGRPFRWRLLKGGVNKGEAKLHAIEREISEETGLKKIEILEQIHSYEFVFREVMHKVTSFLVKADSTEPVVLQESELSDYIWTEPENGLRLLYWRNEKEALRKLGQFDEQL